MADIQKLGRYDIVRVLGKGAMGVVYEGRDPNLDRQVAIKTIRVQSLSSAATAEYEGRFRTEARSAARLHHPNIVSVFDSGQDGDTAYLVMEFIQGEDLKRHLANGARFSVRASLAMVHDLLMALDHAHGQNVVHRDIKPANLLIEPSGRVKLTDFGVARIQEPDETHLTQVGGAVGTPKYMSPEQAKGLRGDSRSDVFSAGVVLYELLTGSLPFDGENQLMVIHQIVDHAPPRPSTVNPEVPAAMDEIMVRALAKNPDQRYATAREFGLALRSLAQQLDASSPHASAGVAAELGQFVSSGAPPAALRDGSSTGIFGPGPDVSMATTVNHTEELGIWNAIRDSTDSQNFLDYLARYPNGIYARRAQLRLDQLALDNTASRADTLPQFRPPPYREPAAPAPGRRSKRWALTLGAVVCAALSWAWVLQPTQPTPPTQVLPEVTPAVAPPSAPIIEEKASDSTPLRVRPRAAPAPAPAPAPASVPMASRAGPSATGQVCAGKVFILRIPCIAEQCKTDRFHPSGECIRFREMERMREEGAAIRQR